MWRLATSPHFLYVAQRLVLPWSHWYIIFMLFWSQEPVLLEGVEVNLCLLGDPAYSLSSWLMKPYPQPLHSTQARRLTEDQERLAAEQESFNVYLISGRMVIECAFGRLKGRWRKLQKRMDMSLSEVPIVVSACCIIHKYCELQTERFYDAWLPDSVTENQRYLSRPLEQILPTMRDR